jgi:hypothetical protein
MRPTFAVETAALADSADEINYTTGVNPWSFMSINNWNPSDIACGKSRSTALRYHTGFSRQNFLTIKSLCT